jgi:hypothetical protein
MLREANPLGGAMPLNTTMTEKLTEATSKKPMSKD